MEHDLHTENSLNASMGALIRAARTERGLKQRELAELLGVTDKAVSKWETGGSCPDIALLIPLAEALHVEVNELLLGRRQPAPDPEALALRTLTYSDQVERQRRRGLCRRLHLLLSAGLLLAGAVCLICDLSDGGGLTWSSIVNLSLLFSWLLLSPPLLSRERRLRSMLAALTASILPYLFILSLLLREPLVFRVGLPVSLLSAAYLWAAYLLCRRLRRRKWLAAAAVLSLTAPLDLCIDLIADPASVFWPEYLLPLLLAAGCLLADYRRREA